MIPQGMGATNFIAGNDTPEHRQMNRRVDIKVPRQTLAAVTAGQAPTASVAAPTASAS